MKRFTSVASYRILSAAAALVVARIYASMASCEHHLLLSPEILTSRNARLKSGVSEAAFVHLRELECSAERSTRSSSGKKSKQCIADKLEGFAAPESNPCLSKGILEVIWGFSG